MSKTVTITRIVLSIIGFTEACARVSRIFFQLGELSLGAVAYLDRQSSIVVPEIPVRPMDHATLKRLCSAGFMICQSAIDALMDVTRLEIGLKLRADRLPVAPLKPQIDVSPLRRQSVNRASMYCTMRSIQLRFCYVAVRGFNGR